MKNQPLTPFQQNAENEITNLLRHVGREIEVREVLEGVVPFVSNDPQAVVKLDAGDLSIWLHANEATFTWGIRGGGGRFERPDYPSKEALLQDLLRQIREVIAP